MMRDAMTGVVSVHVRIHPGAFLPAPVLPEPGRGVRKKIPEYREVTRA